MFHFNFKHLWRICRGLIQINRIQDLTYIYGYPYIRISIYFKTSAMSDLFSPPTLFKCLADATRARLTLLILREGELCVCELIHALDDSQPKISRHLAQLRSCGLLLDRRQGQWIYYRLNPALPAWVTQVLETTLQANQPWLHSDAQRLDAMGDRPQRASTCC
ncbi:ArsR family transcriptional regulator, arsenate/arsenite/antimonite-responsive transcriptional repressor [Pseudomonas tolaasii]